MSYEREQQRVRKLTPLESELRAAPVEALHERRPGPWSRFRAWRRRRRPPRTLPGAIALGVLRLAVPLAGGAVLALLVARWLDRDPAVGFYLVGAAVFGLAFFLSAADVNTPFYGGYDQHERESRLRMSFVYVLVGALLIAVGVVLEAV